MGKSAFKDTLSLEGIGAAEEEECWYTCLKAVIVGGEETWRTTPRKLSGLNCI